MPMLLVHRLFRPNLLEIAVLIPFQTLTVLLDARVDSR